MDHHPSGAASRWAPCTSKQVCSSWCAPGAGGAASGAVLAGLQPLLPLLNGGPAFLATRLVCPGWRPDPLYPEYSADFFDGGCHWVGCIIWRDRYDCTAWHKAQSVTCALCLLLGLPGRSTAQVPCPLLRVPPPARRPPLRIARQQPLHAPWGSPALLPQLLSAAVPICVCQVPGGPGRVTPGKRGGWTVVEAFWSNGAPMKCVCHKCGNANC